MAVKEADSVLVLMEFSTVMDNGAIEVTSVRVDTKMKCRAVVSGNVAKSSSLYPRQLELLHDIVQIVQAYRDEQGQ